jgi:deoxycytidine triphosphate deaminase
MPSFGLLSHEDLRELVLCDAITRDGAEPEIGQNTVRLHIGNVAWIPAAPPEKRRVSVVDGGDMQLEPGEIVTFVTQECIALPPDIGGCIFPRGRVLPVGLFVPTTHVDPGFKGYLRLVAVNFGSARIRVPFGYELARVELTRMVRSAPGAYPNVNAELKALNPQADELVSPSEDVAALALLNRVLWLEETLHTELARRRQRRRAAVLCAAGLASLGLVGGVVVGVRAVGDAASAELTAALAAAAILSLLGIWRMLYRERLRLWLSDWIDA